ncbi:DUF4136 domain-containing protein [Salegentibacter mishustinae]|uniref:DUF4136 domain-containing protein n=1 Tax=Salegentibacter mishustinae TaxID=270918 RepID=A0A0Q9ZL49_9FLAO|nr:DUF4136 domain-containing protein [Salegentibacter mishustinae]KRG30802.1 hypothetical protein APR42_02770 [Salegentibacter mishustinae]PNW23686.1 hypothetical protein APB85_02765 [Salegentibacter mishustinae]PZX66782.1 uncharacterized protein DUF4136 [Salegentibacter mishustinae]UBZ08545.1 DUF4136 domain-containing protein [Salegentibacter mishustinae]GGW84615.1 hypothetical protein GCM10008086_11400 [Salegentibacter mishustinae]|tara:strand:+ start:274 stop:816 length:543 start_codon:yes stop_codon:yes gene_type:complete
MKVLKITPVLLLLAILVTSCSSVRVASDYDREVNFNQYESYAFFKPGIDKAEISDLDKKRILRAIETEMQRKGFTKSEDPDLLVSIFTKTNENINIYQNNMMGWGYGWGWHPWYWGSGFNTVNRTSEGTLYIDLIDAEGKELVWQGMGTAALAEKVDKKQERINEIVSEILEKYPPEIKN